MAGADRAHLEDIRRELQGLRDSMAVGGSGGQGASVKSAKQTEARPAGAKNTDGVRRLLEQRATLLRTGVYPSDDPVIRALDGEIQAAMAAG